MTGVFRAETAGGRSYDAPSAALLFRLLDELGHGNQFLIVDRLDAAGDEHYMQVFREPDGTFVVEYRAGAVKDHYEAETDGVHEAHAVLTGWTTGAPGWRDVCEWRRWPVP